MRRAVTRLFVLVVVPVLMVVSLVAPATVLAKPTPAKYVLPKPAASVPGNVAPVLHVNGGVISWSADKGADHLPWSDLHRSEERRGSEDDLHGPGESSRAGSRPPPPCGTTLYYGVASEGNAGEQWTANEVSITGPKCVVQNVAPVLHVNGGVISWSADTGATTFHGSISTAARNAAGRINEPIRPLDS